MCNAGGESISQVFLSTTLHMALHVSKEMEQTHLMRSSVGFPEARSDLPSNLVAIPIYNPIRNSRTIAPTCLLARSRIKPDYKWRYWIWAPSSAE